VNKKERLERAIAAREAKAYRESTQRREWIKVLWGFKAQDLKATTGEERKLKERKLKKQRLGQLLRDRAVAKAPVDDQSEEVGELFSTLEKEQTADAFVREEALRTPTTSEAAKILVELVWLQDQEIEYLRIFEQLFDDSRAYYPVELVGLIRKSTWAKAVEQAKMLRPAERQKSAAKKEYERRRKVPRIGEIEEEFSGPEKWDPVLGKSTATGHCLDGIFTGDGVSMWRLQRLFGVHRGSLAPRLQSFKRRRDGLYDYRAVRIIMDSLLGEKLPTNKKPARGKPRKLWLSKVRKRVLERIEARVKTLSMPRHIRDEFLKVVHCHLPDSAK